jgi:hypothetical protein
MARFYFDYHEGKLVFPDHIGEELDGVQAARRMAMIALGEAVRDYSAAGHEGAICIAVRDDSGEAFRVASVIKVSSS